MRQYTGICLVAISVSTIALAQDFNAPKGADKFFGGGKDFNDKAMFPKAPGPAAATPAEALLAPKIWSGGLEFGINGTQDSNSILNMRVGAMVDRKTADNVFHSDFLYTLTRDNDATRQNQALWNARDEILFPGSAWSAFASLLLEYDKFRAYDFRVGVYGGVSYAWVDDETTLFKTRLGAGVMHEMSSKRNGPPDRWVPEAVLGFDFNHRFTERQSFVSSLDLYPSLRDPGQYRLRARAAYEILIDPEYGMVLRLGIQERYDSAPGDGPRNALNYFATLLLKF